jgi:hypothetical protein
MPIQVTLRDHAREEFDADHRPPRPMIHQARLASLPRNRQCFTRHVVHVILIIAVEYIVQRFES